MTQPPYGQPPEYGQQPQSPYGPPQPPQQPPPGPWGQQPGHPGYGQPGQYGQQPGYDQPQFTQPYGSPQFDVGGPPGPYPPRRSNRNLILAIIGVLVIAGGAVAAVLLLTGDDDGGTKNQAGRPGRHAPVSGNPNPGGATSFPTDNGASVPAATAVLSCTGIQDAMIRSGVFDKGSITVADGGSAPNGGLPQPSGSPTTTCTVRPTDPNDASDGIDHLTVIAWSGTSEHQFGAQLKGAGYHASSEGEYTVYIKGSDPDTEVVTATISDQLVTFYSG